jgi:hypothetical protein
MSPLLRLTTESGILLVAFLGLLMFVAAQRSLYLGLFHELAGTFSTKDKVPVSALKQTI